MRLAKQTVAKVEVVELFAFLHDARRLNDGHDPQHGARAAAFAQQLRADGVLKLGDDDLHMLTLACAQHSAGLVEGSVTVVTCWDVDRLDLGRVGIRSSARYLCTDAAKDPSLIDWAYQCNVRA